MTQTTVTKVAIAISTFACTALLSFSWSEQRGVTLSVESAQARVGRPLTPVSVAGVARRHNRRAAYGYGYGPGVVGAGLAGAAAVGTAAAVAATSPGWGWGGGPYYTGTGYAGGPYYGGAGYYAGGPYYQRGALGARAAYYGGGGNYQPGLGWGGVSSKDYELYRKNLHDSGYDTKNNFNSSGNVATQ